MATFPSLNEQQRLEARVAKPGKYKIYLEHVEEKKTKTNNPMFCIVAKFNDNNGKERTIYSNLVISEPNIENVYKFCRALNRPDLYDQGNIEARDIRSNYVYADVEIEHYEHNNEKRIKNVVKEWLAAGAECESKDATAEFKDDDIDF